MVCERKTAKVTAGEGPRNELMASDQHFLLLLLYTALVAEVRACVGFLKIIIQLEILNAFSMSSAIDGYTLNLMNTKTDQLFRLTEVF